MTSCLSHNGDDITGASSEVFAYLAPKNLQQATLKDMMQAIFKDRRLPSDFSKYPIRHNTLACAPKREGKMNWLDFGAAIFGIAAAILWFRSASEFP